MPCTTIKCGHNYISKIIFKQMKSLSKCLPFPCFCCVIIHTLSHILPLVYFMISSVQLSGSVVSNSLRPPESQHARLPCPSQTPRVYSNLCPSSWWCHPAISSSVTPFSSCPQSLPASGSFLMSQLFAWGGQSTGVSAFSISPSNEHPGLISFRMDWLDLLQSKGLSRVFSNTTVQKH